MCGLWWRRGGITWLGRYAVRRSKNNKFDVVVLSKLEFSSLPEGCSYPALCVTTSTVVPDELCARRRDFRRSSQLDREVG